MTTGRIQTTLIYIMLMIHVLSAGTTGKISGRVTDKETGEPLIGANVMVDGPPLGAATDTDGNYYILFKSDSYFSRKVFSSSRDISK